ncbi:MAG: orotidine-5'-phosphate decarboxylase [Defluviitaleaceae bacterium]|nr:orotidine-5'-phosphate decarboxylase [Defluviitaleaceae bacterium]
MLIDRLITKIQETRAPIVVGLDPRLDQIPADTFFEFNKGIIDEIYDIVPAVKPQIAMYERHGISGLECYFRTIEYAQSKGLIVIADIKRGDIASTAEAYSEAHLGSSAHATADFVTINPYMGYDSVEPYFSDCKKHDKGLFILVKTSNKGSRDIQDLPMQNGQPLYMHVGELVSKWGEPLMGEMGYSALGAVVGATHPQEALTLRKSMPHTFFLVPGYGAQGGSGSDLAGLWAGDRYGAIVNSSRGITSAYQTKKFAASEKDYAKAAREAVLDMKKDLEAYM